MKITLAHRVTFNHRKNVRMNSNSLLYVENDSICFDYNSVDKEKEQEEKQNENENEIKCIILLLSVCRCCRSHQH